jgi:hypothetical protein
MFCFVIITGVERIKSKMDSLFADIDAAPVKASESISAGQHDAAKRFALLEQILTPIPFTKRNKRN